MSTSEQAAAAIRAARAVLDDLASISHASPQEVVDLLAQTAELARIVDLQIASLAKRLTDRRLTLTVTAAAREWLTLTGYDPVYGARPLRRLVQKAIGDTLARALLSGDVRDGDEVVVDRNDAGDALTVAPAVRAEA